MYKLGGAAAIDSWGIFVERLGGSVIQAYKDLNDQDRPLYASESVEGGAIICSVSWK